MEIIRLAASYEMDTYMVPPTLKDVGQCNAISTVDLSACLCEIRQLMLQGILCKLESNTQNLFEIC